MSSDLFGIGGNVYKYVETELLGPLLKNQLCKVNDVCAAPLSNIAPASAKASPKVTISRDTTQKRPLDDVESALNTQKKQKCHISSFAATTISK